MSKVDVCDNCGVVFRKVLGFFPISGKTLIQLPMLMGNTVREFCCLKCARDYLSKMIGDINGQDK